MKWLIILTLLLTGCEMLKNEKVVSQKVIIDIACEQTTPDGYTQRCTFSGDRKDKDTRDEGSTTVKHPLQ